MPMTEVALAAGFGSVRRFNETFRARIDRPPRALRRARAPRAIADAPAVDAARCRYAPPYDWDAMLAFLAARAIPGVEVVDGRRATGARSRSTARAARSRSRRSPARTHLAATIALRRRRALPAIVARVRRVFDLGADVERDRARSSRATRASRRSSRARPGLRVPGAWDGFELAVRAILGQQVTRRGGAHARGTARRARYGEPLDGARVAGRLARRLPAPARARGRGPRALGMPRARAAALAALAARGGRGPAALRPSATISTRRSRASARSAASASGRRSTSRCARCASRTRSRRPTSACCARCATARACGRRRRRCSRARGGVAAVARLRRPASLGLARTSCAAARRTHVFPPRRDVPPPARPDGILVLANVWDAASARLFQSLGARGARDDQRGRRLGARLSRRRPLPARVLRGASRRSRAWSRVPLSVDCEAGYSDDPRRSRRRRRRDRKRAPSASTSRTASTPPDLLAAKIEAMKGRPRGGRVRERAHRRVPEVARAGPSARRGDAAPRGATRPPAPTACSCPARRPRRDPRDDGGERLPVNVLVRAGPRAGRGAGALGVRRLSAGGMTALAALGAASRAVRQLLTKAATTRCSRAPRPTPT